MSGIAGFIKNMLALGVVTANKNPLTGEIGFSGNGATKAINSPLAGVQLCAAMGDSITYYGYQVGAGYIRYSATGYTSWLQALSMGRIWFPLAKVQLTSVASVNYNKGIFGQTTADMILRLTDITNLSPRPRFCTVLAGTNDLSVAATMNDSAETIFARWRVIVETIANAGIIPIVSTILPRSVWGSLTAPQILVARGKLMQINRYIRAYTAGRSNMALADAWQQTVNFGSATSDPIAGMFSDGIHPNELGAYAVGKVFSDAVDRFLAPYSASFCGTGDMYDVSNNPFGSLVDSSFAAGGGTASSGASAAGNGVPLGWTAGRQSGATSTMTVQQRARADGGNGNEVLLTTTGLDATQFRIYPGTSLISSTNFAAGDAVYAESESVFSGVGAGQSGNSDMYLQAQSSTEFVNALYNAGTAVPGTYSLLLRTPLLIQPAAPVDVSFFAYDSIANGGASTVVRRNLAMRKYNKQQTNSVL